MMMMVVSCETDFEMMVVNEKIVVDGGCGRRSDSLKIRLISHLLLIEEKSTIFFKSQLVI